MTIKEARRILGKAAQGVSDADLQSDIETATLFKDIFFSLHTRKLNRLAIDSQKCHNSAVYGKESNNLH